jgi:peptidoglycan/LPS O-acetylase OafA/YrhL
MFQHKWFFNFDGLRFFAALLVIVTHIESIKKDFGFPSFYSYSFFTNAGPLAVTFFFVLSGFLIAYLLMRERQQNPGMKINILRFYRNRILRIWPLYYLLVLASFLALPYLSIFQFNDFNKSFLSAHANSFLLYLFFLPNYSNHEYGNVLYLGQVWSLGVEEFFYLFFPIGLYFLPAKRYVYFFILLIGASVAITAFSKLWCKVDDQNLPLTCIYISRYRIYAFALGALSAYAYIKSKDKTFLTIYKQQLKIVGNVLFGLILVLLFSGTTFSSLTHPLYSVMFAALLFLLTVTGIKIRLLNHPYMVYLGKISYGVYMLHPLAIVIALRLFSITSKNAILDVILFDLLTVALVIALAIASYHFFERLFLKMRK